MIQIRAKLHKKCIRLLDRSYDEMLESISKAIDSGAVDIDGWDDINESMVLPKAILTAILQIESTQYDCKGTCYEKQIRKDVKNLKPFL